MGRKLSKPRPKQGARLAELRKAVGLSQYELAARVNEPQANIAFGERSSKPPRADALPKLAKALGVSLDALLLTESRDDKLKLTQNLISPTPKLRRFFEKAALLPRYQQDKLADFLDPFLNSFIIRKDKDKDKDKNKNKNKNKRKKLSRP